MADRPPFARIAIVGVPGAGKTSLFCALTGVDYARAIAGTGKTVKGTVRVLDERLARLHRTENPKAKLTPPTLELHDTPPLFLEGHDKERNRGVLAQFNDMNGLLLALKAYDVEGGPEEKKKAVEAQREGLDDEMLLSDLEALQKRVNRIKDRVKRSIPAAERQGLEKQRDVIVPLIDRISSGDKNALAHVPPDIEKELRSFALFAGKPRIPVVNVSENDLGKVEGSAFRLELELLGMPEEERAEYMRDYGMDALAIPRLPLSLMSLFGYVTFLTPGDKEISGWAVPKGTTAKQAAGAVHTDMERGFINAEVISWADWEACGSVHEAERTKERVEGKDYVVRDFDIINFKFAV